MKKINCGYLFQLSNAFIEKSVTYELCFVQLMSFQSPETTREIPFEERVPVGERVLGLTDPRRMTREEFGQSPDLLFHGSAMPLEFQDAFDYRSESYIRENDGSTTLGFGLYTTDSRSDAEEYSRVRQAGQLTAKNVSHILPSQARVLDLRWQADKTRNAPFPRELAEAWRTAFMEYFKTRKPRDGNIGAILDSSEIQYAQFLERALQAKAVDLRVLLETASDPILKSRNLPSPYWSYLFSDFMIKQGYDGLVYNEGGEGWGTGATSYVFYNLKKVGTFESWQAWKE